MENMGDYHDHCLKKDIFEKFIATCLKCYEHDPCSPGLSWEAMLKMSGVQLEKISDIDKY